MEQKKVVGVWTSAMTLESKEEVKIFEHVMESENFIAL